MRVLICGFLFFISALYAQQTSPYAEFYALAGDTTTVVKNVSIISYGLKARIFSAKGEKINAKIVLAEISLVHNATISRTIISKNSNEFNLNEFSAFAHPGDKIIIKIKQVENLDRKSPVYLSKIDFSFTLQ